MEQLVNNIIRPPRAEYDPGNDLLDEEFMLKGKWYQRKDLEIKNIRGDILKCSHYVPIICPEGKPLPCVIYCHGNSGCRADASEAAIVLLPSNITVFTLDFSGSGLSGGEHVTLGWNEKDDLKSAVEYLRRDGNISSIGLWGRSMGAVTSLMYGAQDPSIAGMVLDSPFSNLVDLMMEVARTKKILLPKFALKYGIQYMRRTVLKKAKFDITELDTIKIARCCFVPLLLGHAVDDDFILPHHSDRIFDAYMGEKDIIKFDGDHNSPRPKFYFDSISIFFNTVLQPPDDDSFFDIPPDYLCKVQSDISSEDKKSDAEKAIVACRVSSVSNPISFELSNGVPASIDNDDDEDDDYVEFPLDNLTDFTESFQEEDKMFKEAEKESSPLEDTKTGPHAEEQPTRNENQELLQECDSRDSSQDSSNESAMTLILTANGNDSNKISEPSDSILSANEPVDDVSSAHDTSVDYVDLFDHTKVTITIIKNPSSNIMDGLLRRWDLNFLRSKRRS